MQISRARPRNPIAPRELDMHRMAPFHDAAPHRSFNQRTTRTSMVHGTLVGESLVPAFRHREYAGEDDRGTEASPLMQETPRSVASFRRSEPDTRTDPDPSQQSRLRADEEPRGDREIDRDPGHGIDPAKTQPSRGTPLQVFVSQLDPEDEPSVTITVRVRDPHARPGESHAPGLPRTVDCSAEQDTHLEVRPDYGVPRREHVAFVHSLLRDVVAERDVSSPVIQLIVRVSTVTLRQTAAPQECEMQPPPALGSEREPDGPRTTIVPHVPVMAVRE